MLKLGRIMIKSTVCIVALSLSAAACDADTVPEPLQAHEAGLRRIAIEKPEPEYPLTSIEQRVSGVAVASVLIDVDGRTKRVEVLEAPDEQIAASLKKAIAQWRFPPPSIIGSSEHFEMTGKLTYYFDVIDGKGVVSSPEARRNLVKASHKGWVVPNPTAFEYVSAADLPSIRQRFRAKTVDVRTKEQFDRRHDSDALHVPLAELEIKALATLAGYNAIILDCGTDAENCKTAAGILRKLGWSSVFAIRRDQSAS